jgi:hypothetical protein
MECVMNRNVRNKRLWVVTVCALVALAITPAWSQTVGKSFSHLHQVGLRLGGWANMGDTPVKSGTDGTTIYNIDFKGGCFYLEAFVGMRFSRYLMGELSLGLFNRGDVNLRDDIGDYFGSLLVYPIRAKLVVYPFGGSKMRLQPYLSGGGGLYYARHNIDFIQSNYYILFDETHATSFELSFGGGMDLPLSSRIALNTDVSYMPLNFSKDLITIRNYDGMSITVGIKYLFSSFGGGSDPRRRRP